MKNYVILLITTFTLLSCTHKSNENSDKTGYTTKILTVEEYQQDFNKMVELVLENHPQPYAFISEDSLTKLTNIQYNKISDTTTVGGFLWICKAVVAAINCMHTDMWFSPESGQLPPNLLFPMNVRYDGPRLYVIDAKNNTDKLAAGTEILSINGVEVERLQKGMFKHVSADGFNQTLKHENTNIVFHWYCSLLFNFPNSYTVKVAQNGKTEVIKLKPANNIENTRSYLGNCENQLCFNTDSSSNTAIMTIRSFGYYKKRFPIFKSFVDDCFKKIKEDKIKNLIIDVRNNGGGDPFCSSYLLQYIADIPYTYFDKDVKWYRSLKREIQPNPNRFTGKPFILTNGLCASTTGHFCSLVKENNFGILVGDETGATYTCNDFSKYYTLKNTKLLVRYARKIVKTTASTLSNKHGIIPDHYVIPNIDNYLNNTDTVLNFTLNLIEKE